MLTGVAGLLYAGVVVCRRCYRTVAETPPTSYSRSSGRLVLACLFAHLGLPPNSDHCSWIAVASTFRAQWFSSGCDCFSSPGNSQCVEFTFMDRTTSVDDTTALLSHLERSGFNACQSMGLDSSLSSFSDNILIEILVPAL